MEKRLGVGPEFVSYNPMSCKLEKGWEKRFKTGDPGS